MLRALGFSNDTYLYVASGEIYGGEETLQPLRDLFPNFYTKAMLAGDDLKPFLPFSSRLTAIDFIGKRLVFVTNNSTKSRKKFETLGLNVNEVGFLSWTIRFLVQPIWLDEPGRGSMIGAILGSTKQEPLVVGKPSTFMDYLAKKFGIATSQICMVGDRLDTDILFGQNEGCKTLLVLSGVTSVQMLQSPDNSIQPDFYTNSQLGKILSTHLQQIRTLRFYK
ncbi:hypothetical protein ABZP36_026375 [Zizania latifolia]